MFLRVKVNTIPVPVPKTRVMKDYRRSEGTVSCSLSFDTELPIHASSIFTLAHKLWVRSYLERKKTLSVLRI